MNGKVLVVDDSKVTREMHGFMLQSGGYEVHYAINGSEASAMMLEAKFDLVVTDVNMPQMDGYELSRRIRAMPGYESTPIIMVSTEADAKDKTLGFEAGINVYLVKPARPANLVANARMLLNSMSGEK